MTIPDPEGKGGLPKESFGVATESLETVEAPEVTPYKISFARYKEKECQMDSMSGQNARATLKVFKDVGLYYTDEKNYWSKAGPIEIKHIVRGGDYGDLYRNLSEDTELKEIKYKHDRKEIDIRLFFFTLEVERTFYLVAARHDHIDTGKGGFRRKG
jgi:hypothetical protein